MGIVTSATAQGMRPAQEDRMAVVEVDGGLALAVFDGHNGAATAETAARLFPDAFRDSLERYGAGRACVEATIGILREATADRFEGSSASVVHVDERGGTATVGVLGDSPVIVRDAAGEVVLAPVHNTGADPDGAEAAVERGAERMGPYLVDPSTGEGVNLTRTIGDAPLRFLGRTPDVLTVDLGSSSYVVVASDGVVTPDAPSRAGLVSRIERLMDEGADAEAIVDDALASGSDDNVTVVLWRASG